MVMAEFWVGKFHEDLFLTDGMAAWTFLALVIACALVNGGSVEAACLDLH